MIQVVINRVDQKIKAFEVSGHADSGPMGQDLVCAGVSAITFGAVNAIIKLCEIDPIIDQAGDEGGYLRVELPTELPFMSKEKAEWLLEGMLVSLETIELDYDQFISISEK
ncbi:ribosomal-processing cysteine protease Prp [Saliterribacillus persicus]|uniref:Ribosomal processing cysteine protease Prp n=1 Tax=Saliterribacillus persicus TaxID=930114 RepID=A0A368XEM3_9BACI|nr:ribosomal-processing cysteine protease Prp [Saliterribacillus persicus]RCW66413.1 hypothetical protein DFR57_109136 [Saliterribacillus persicus]